MKIMFLQKGVQVIFLMQSKQKESRRNTNKKAGESLLNRKIIAPQKLKILVLAGNDLTSDHLEFLEKCINLIKLDLSHNHIVKLQPTLDLSQLHHLEVAFLHHNKLTSVASITPIVQCQTLTFLTYHHNPMQSTLRHEHEIINFLPNLKLINNRIVFLEERSDHLFPQRVPVLADMEMLQNWKSTQNSETYYLKVLNLQLQYIDNLWAFSNPIVIIQRAWKHFLPQSPSPLPSSQAPASRPSRVERGIPSRSKASSKMESLSTPHPLRQWFFQWKSFSESLKFVRWSMKNCDENGVKVDKSYMLYPLPDYQTQLRNMRVSRPLLNFLSKIRRKIYERKMAKKLIVNIRMKQTLFQSQSSFYHLSGIKQTHRFYYNRAQKHILDNFLVLIAQNFNKREVVFNQSKNLISKQFNAIRLVDPESFTNKYSQNKYHSICSLVWPSMKVVVSYRKLIASQFKAGIIGIPQLTYIKNRDKVLTNKELEKSKEIYQRLQKFAKNQYETSLFYFQCKDQFVMKQLTRMIYYHNSRAVRFEVKEKRSQMMAMLQNFEEPFIFYVDNVIKRTAAAVAIQKTWRRYISNKNQAESIYHKMKKNRAALHIQRFFRNSIYRHRLHFHKKLARDLARLNTNTIIYPLTFYMNLNQIFKYPYESSLFRRVRVTRAGHIVGLIVQFFKPIFQERIREDFFKGQRLGTQNHPTEIDLYNLLHFKVSTSILFRNGTYFISFTYPSQPQANIVASIIALLSYQLWGSYYVWPLTKQNLGQWQSRIDQYLKIKIVKQFVSPFKQQGFDLIPLEKQEVKESGLFVWKSETKTHINLPDLTMETQQINVQFYQKRYQNYPIKQIVKLNYAMINQPISDKKEEELIQSDSEVPKAPTEPLRRSDFAKEGPLNITTIDKRRFSLFDQSEKTLRPPQPDPIESMGATQGILEKEKKKQTMKFQQYLRKKAQKEFKETTLAGVREKAKKQKVLNSTLRSLKEAQRTEALRSRVQKVKEFKQRSVQKREEEEFVQQNNFVMKQQLKMMIMRGKMKEAEEKKDEFLIKKSSIHRNSEILAPSIPSRKSSRQKERRQLEEEPSIEAGQSHAIGEQGSIVNTKKRTKKRAQSIGAYMRDPSFVHGVFPQEYYPIESRATSFYFPPVV